MTYNCLSQLISSRDFSKMNHVVIVLGGAFEKKKQFNTCTTINIMTSSVSDHPHLHIQPRFTAIKKHKNNKNPKPTETFDIFSDYENYIISGLSL